MKHGTALSTMLVVIIAAGIVLVACQSTRPAFSSVNQELEYIVAEAVRGNEQTRNCVLYVKKGDNSFTWAGAAGMARQDGQVPMSRDTPIYLASITKLFTAVLIMRLCEQGELSLDDPMAKHLPDELINGIHVYKGHDYSREITIAQLLSHTSAYRLLFGEGQGRKNNA
jgi:CubicO group peptidase (beta-lactamase class C family)